MINEQFVDRRTRAVLRKNSDRATRLERRDDRGRNAGRRRRRPERPDHAVTGADRSSPAWRTRRHQAKEELDALQAELPPTKRPSAPENPPAENDADAGAPSRSRTSPTWSRSESSENGSRPIRRPNSAGRRSRPRSSKGADGLRRTRLVTAPAVDKVVSPATLFPVDELHVTPAGSAPRRPCRPGAPQRAGGSASR